jgi:DNA polymerase-1
MTTKKKTPSRIRVLVDADPFVYKCGFASQHTYYIGVADQGDVTDEFDGLTARKEFLANQTVPEMWTWYERTEVEPVENALHSVKKQLEETRTKIKSRFNREPVMELYLTGVHNFREVAATIRPYKGNRKPWHQPRLKKEIREYLVEHHGAKIIHKMEADDAVSIRQTECTKQHIASIIVSIDKDLLQVPGWHYNPDTQEFKKITQQQGCLNLYRQIITGDSTDNIAGVYKAGEKAAERALTENMSEQEMVAECIEMFDNSIHKYGPDRCGYSNARDAYQETYNLVHMLRERP